MPGLHPRLLGHVRPLGGIQSAQERDVVVALGVKGGGVGLQVDLRQRRGDGRHAARGRRGRLPQHGAPVRRGREQAARERGGAGRGGMRAREGSGGGYWRAERATVGSLAKATVFLFIRMIEHKCRYRIKFFRGYFESWSS